MRARDPWLSRSIAVATALALAACGEAATPPAKTAGGAPEGTAPAAASSAPAGAPSSTGAPSSEAAASTPAPSAAQPAPSAADGYVFQKKMPAVGARVLESETKTMSLTLNVGGKSAKDKPIKVVKNDRDTVEKAVEVLAVTADAITKVKVTYRNHSKVEAKDGADKTTKAPVAGKTYVAEAKNGAVSVLTEKGAPAPAEEAKIVQKDFKSLGKPDDFQKALPDKPIKVGDKVDSIARALEERMTRDDDGTSKTTVESTSVTFVRAGEKGGVKTGVFEIAIDLAMDKGGMVIRMKMKGEVELRLDDGFPVSMSFQAPVTVGTPAGAPGPKISGAGLTTMMSTREIL